MNRLEISSFALVLLLAVSPAAVEAVRKAPNILLITVDTLRADRLSGYGYERDTSPQLDALLATGARFTQARTVEPLTAPAVASMITSVYPHRHGSTRNGIPMRDGLMSFPKILSRRGYRTAAFVGNWTLRDELSGLAEHFDVFTEVLNRKRWFGLAKRESTAEDVTEEALDWLEDHQSQENSKPFLLWIHYVEPHAPYRVHSEFLEQVGVKKGVTVFSAGRRYDTEVAFIDAHIREMLSRFEELAPEREVLTVFASDHGESLGEHSYWGHGRHLYEATLAIPLGFIWPERIDAAEIEAPAMILDFAPTILGLLDLPVPDFFVGFDWSQVLLNQTEISPDRVTWHQAHKASVQPKEDNSRVRRKGLLEVGRVEGMRKEICRLANDRRRVFSLAADPEEKTSLVALESDCSEELAAWLEEVRAGLDLADDVAPPSLSEEDLAALEALGYID